VPPSELSDALVSQIVSSWKAHAPEELTETISKTIVHYREQSMLARFFIKLEDFVNIISPEITPSLIRSLYQYSKHYSKDAAERGRNTEFFRASHLIVDLLSINLEKMKVQTILEEIMEHAESLDFAYTVYTLCVQESKTCIQVKWKILPIIRKAFVDRFKKQFIVPQTSFFTTEEPAYVLVRLWDYCAEEENVNLKDCTCSTYVNNMLEGDIMLIGKVLGCFITKSMAIDTMKTYLELNINEVSNYIDTKELYEKIMNDVEYI